MAKAHARNELQRVIHLAEKESREYHDVFVGADRVLSVIVKRAIQGRYRGGAFSKFIRTSAGSIIQELQKLPSQIMRTDSDLKPIEAQSLKETIRFAKEEARKMMGQGLPQSFAEEKVNREIGIDYLVLGMLRMVPEHRTCESRAAQILYSLGLTFERAQKIVRGHRLQKKSNEMRKEARDVINDMHRILRKKSNVIVEVKRCAKRRI